jgi:hypothetical protein
VKKILCLFGHRWERLAYSTRTLILCHISPMLGTLQRCTRCGKVWDDLPHVLRREKDELLGNPPSGVYR